MAIPDPSLQPSMSVRLLDLDLAAPSDLPDVSVRHGWIRVLIKLNGSPVGFLHVRNTGQQLDTVKVGQQATAELAGPLWAEMEVERLKRPNDVPAEQPEISVVICTKDRPKELEGCLAALSAQRYPRYEVLVIDNASEGDCDS